MEKSTRYRSVWLNSKAINIIGAVCILIIASWSANASAQRIYTLSGSEYVLVEWPSSDTNSAYDIISNTWPNEFGNGSISLTAEGSVSSAPATAGDYFVDPTIYGLDALTASPTPQFMVNNGQSSNQSDPELTANYNINATNLPREILFYAGGATNGLKYTRWTWSSTQPNTHFELLGSSSSFLEVTGSGTNTLFWKTYGALNNSAVALIRITNPAGISNFSVTSNRLNSLGNDYYYGNVNQRADFSEIAILIQKAPLQAVSPVPILALPTLIIMAGLLLLLAWRDYKNIV